MRELTVEKIVPLLTSPAWYKRLVGEYYEVLIRCEKARNQIAKMCYRMRTGQALDTMVLQKEIEMMKEQLEIMSQYECVLRKRIVHHGIQYVDILSDSVKAADVLEGEEE